MSKALVVDDEEAMRLLLQDVLEAEGFEVVAVADGQSAVDRVAFDVPAIIILDLRMPGIDGMVTLEKLRAIAPQTPVVILTAYGDIPSAVQAMRLGAHDYLRKPLRPEEIVNVVRRALEHRQLKVEIDDLRRRVGKGSTLRWLLGRSAEIQQVVQQVSQVADSTFTVLIQGETGTGKELVARAVHQLSSRREKPFLALDCGAIPNTLIESELFGYEKGAFTGADRRKEGHFELAEGGSLFLDEISNLPVTAQSKLLRVLQEREVQVLGAKQPLAVDVRIIAASNVPLEGEMQAGRFRQDLYYRLSEFTIHLPPLRGRGVDILYLAKQFVAEASMEFRRPVRGISEEAAQFLVQHLWPGNVRELRNVIRRAVFLSSDVVRAEHLMTFAAKAPGAPAVADVGLSAAGLSLKEVAGLAARQAEHEAIRQALRVSRGNKSEAARMLKIDYKTLHLKMRRHGIYAREFASET